MEKTTLLYEGKAKKIWRTADENLLISEFKDSLTAFNGEKKSSEEGKGALNNQISTELFKFLEEKGIPTHYVDTIDENNMLHKAAEVIYIEVIVRNIATGSLSKNLGIADKTILPFTLVEFDYKNDELGDPKLNDQHCLLLNLVDDSSELYYLRYWANRINDILKELFLSLDITLVDFKLEFGKDNYNNIMLIDELSPDNFRLWDVNTGKKMDKDVFREGTGSITDVYEDVLKRIEEKLNED